MDYEPQQEAASSSFRTSAAIPTTLTDRVIRSSSRLRKKREEDEHPTGHLLNQRRGGDLTGTTSTPVRASKKNRRYIQSSTASAVLINESSDSAKDQTTDLKGKKRAVPEVTSDTESSSASKKPRSSNSYSLRSKKESAQMPKKTRSTTKTPKSSAKGKAIANAGPSRFDDGDEMMDVDFGGGTPDNEERMNEDEDHPCEDRAEKSDEDQHDEDNHPQPPAEGTPDARRSLEETMAMFDFARLGGYMSQLNSRLRTLLNNIKPSADPSTKLIALQELSELLSISTEDTLAGSLQVESFVRELVRILGGTGGEAAQDEADDDDENDEDDAALAAAIQLSAGNGDDNLEAQLLACRCLANLMEALPGCAHTLVYHGAIPVLCGKLLEISYIDLAEQTLLTLEKISEEYPSAIVREGGLSALLNYLDFFSIAVQRTALQAAANCCRNASPDCFSTIKDVWSIIRNCLGYADQRIVDYASLCVIRIIDSYHRSHADKLETLFDSNLIRSVNMLLLPAGGSPLVPPATFTLMIRSLATAARASPTISLSLLQADIVTTVYQILTGVLPPSVDGEEQGDSTSGQGLGGGLADMTVMQNLAHRPKEQIEETLSLVSELMPPLPKDGIFDHKGYSEKALHRMMKAKARAERAAARSSAAVNSLSSQSGGQSPSSSRAHTPTGGPGEDDSGTPVPVRESPDTPPVLPPPLGAPKEPAVDRLTLLQEHAPVVNRFIGLVVPILVDVYAASVSVPVRIKAITALLKAVCFQNDEHLKLSLKNVPIASFISSILSAKDHPNLMIGGLQMVEALLSKASGDYKSPFRREGALHEIEQLALRPLPPRPKDREKEKAKEETREDGTGSTPAALDASLPVPPSAASSSRRTHLLDPEDAYTLRARVIRFKYLNNDAMSDGDATFTCLRHLVETLKRPDASLDRFRDTLRELADLFSSSSNSVSSFELLQSGLVDALLLFASSDGFQMSVARRQSLLLEELAPVKGGKLLSNVSPLGMLVKKLQESLTRMESFEVTTVTPGLEDSKRSSPSLLARQIRLRLVPDEDGDSSRVGGNIVVSIHAIATFQALNDYLRPRLSGLLSSMGGSRLSGMLAALASGRFPEALGGGPLPGSASSSQFPPAAQSATAAGTANAAIETRAERRRSLRLNSKTSSGSLKESSTASSTAAAPPSTASTSTVAVAPSSRDKSSAHEDIGTSESGLHDDDDENSGDYMDADVDAEVFEEDLDEGEEGVGEKTVTLSVVDDGSKIEAQTPDGTRVVTPNPASGSSVPISLQKQSYAAALKNKGGDWHLEFSMDGHVLPLDMTIYGAIHQHETRKSPGGAIPSSTIWQGIYNVKYKKITGMRQIVEKDPTGSPARSRSPASTAASLSEDEPHAKILKVLRILHKLNVQIVDNDAIDAQPISETAFINNKLTAKLTRQLEEPMIVASACLPEWAMDLPHRCPFIFPFSTRFSFLQSTSFGYARLILKWQSQARAQESSRRDDNLGFLGRLQRQKVRISRKHILESAFKVFELYGSSSSILEVEYFDEVGTGLGPTLEFYSMVSKELARRDLKIWRDADTTYPGVHVHHPTGLFPAPMGSLDSASDGGEKRYYIFRIIGQFVAKAMLDSRIIDMSFNRVFLRMILSEDIPITIGTLKHVDPTLASSLKKIQALIEPTDVVYPQTESVLGSIDDLMLDYTLPGYDIELCPGGKNTPVTSNNVKDYIHKVLDATIGKGVEPQVKAFREGFSRVFPVSDLQAFSADELNVLFGSAEEDWSAETVMESIKADHGFNMESPTIRDLVLQMSEFNATSRRNFLQFITGSPRLPIDGFRGLNPPLTVVRKLHETPLTADDYLPSVMTCVNYLKLPQYSSKGVLLERLETAMKEGVGSFHLS